MKQKMNDIALRLHRRLCQEGRGETLGLSALCKALQSASGRPLATPHQTVPSWADHPVAGRLVLFPGHSSWLNWQRDQVRADWSNVDVRLKAWSRRVVKAAADRGVPLYVHTAMRSQAEQERLKADGFSQLTSGPHQRGVALDLVHTVHAWDMTRDEWQFLHDFAMSFWKETVPLRWGGDFQSLYDPAHYELHPWREVVPQLRGF